jgi:hypothetical protein
MSELTLLMVARYNSLEGYKCTAEVQCRAHNVHAASCLVYTRNVLIQGSSLGAHTLVQHCACTHQ